MMSQSHGENGKGVHKVYCSAFTTEHALDEHGGHLSTIANWESYSAAWYIQIIVVLMVNVFRV